MFSDKQLHRFPGWIAARRAEFRLNYQPGRRMQRCVAGSNSFIILSCGLWWNRRMRIAGALLSNRNTTWRCVLRAESSKLLSPTRWNTRGLKRWQARAHPRKRLAIGHLRRDSLSRRRQGSFVAGARGFRLLREHIGILPILTARA